MSKNNKMTVSTVNQFFSNHIKGEKIGRHQPDMSALVITQASSSC